MTDTKCSEATGHAKCYNLKMTRKEVLAMANFEITMWFQI